jgi:putative transposase
MPNHVHLVISPEKDDGLPDIMHDINLNYSRYHKKRYGRIGRLWQGNYRKYLIDTYEYLLTCGIYVELNPVRASLCETPGEYRWSSHRFYISQSEWDFLEKSPNFLCMGQDDEERGMNYKGLTDVWLSNPTTRHEVKKLFIEGAVRFHPMFEK